MKFVEHFLWIASSMVHAGDDVGMWDEEDGFFYDVLRLPDGAAPAPEGALDGRAAAALRGHGVRRRRAGADIRSCRARVRRFLEARPELTAFIHDPSRARAARTAGSPRS